MKKVTGIGGIFFKSNNPEHLKSWYQKHLGIDTDTYGWSFKWRQETEPDKTGITQWSLFPEDTTYFEPSNRPFMVNYRVENLELLLEELKKEGVQIVDEIATYEYGKFLHILDEEGNGIELWEPVDEAFE